MSKPGVHIIPAGMEYDRVIKPLFKDFTVSKAYILINDQVKGKDFGEQQQAVNKFVKAMKKVPIEWEEVNVDIYDFNETFKTVYGLINKEVKKGNPVYINVSSAPKILQVALTMAAFLNKEHGDVELFYVEPEKYYEGELVGTVLKLLDKKEDQKMIVEKLKALAKEIEAHGMAQGESKIHEFPPFPIAEVTGVEYAMLKAIREQKDGVSSIKEMKELLDKSSKSPTPRSNVKYYLDNLQKLGLVRTERDKKELNIRLTKIGELFADTKSDNID